ncbi:hypothetical protein DICPUDRAFT_92118 [Dictyostelium purpureum]|uniref:Homeobox domain-containing protein n=1 Tax=Dictyostelium purpureum TaxID=5786 RepID=F0ZMC4_DICPU|nr:uncharacterized protein DICPUDRAFT_92118 [Dictyostelium purpureum]EGC34876.1 hypothetical protein DICPUDRAFT_92118 [Dictyostelium purpureum]|eukprot:XP_003288568.1 hypothetical protein DICPUDRAFT_92118 [Dictyostelium purpureum]
MIIKEFNSRSIRNVRSSGISTDLLENFFINNPYPSREDIRNLAFRYQVEEIKIKNWFKGKRDRLKTKNRKTLIKDTRMNIRFILNNN